MWTTIALIFLTIIALFLLGVYLIMLKIGNSVSGVPKYAVKEVFKIIRSKLFKENKVE